MALMSAERERGDYPLKAASQRGWGSVVPAWLLRWRLRATEAEIARLETALGQEFGVTETAPMHRDLEALHVQRERLLQRLAGRG